MRNSTLSVIIFGLVLLVGCVMGHAQDRSDLTSKPPQTLSDFQLVNKNCYGPIPLQTPALQVAHNGVYESLSISGDQMDYIQDGQDTTVNVRFGVGNWTSSVFELAGAETSKVVPLYEPGTGTANQVGLMKICSPTFNFFGELHLRIVIGGVVKVPSNGADFQRFMKLQGAGI